MAPTTENIPEKPPFDVYGMMLILCFVFTLGATLLLNDELDKNWDFWYKKESPPKRAVTLTEINDDPGKFSHVVKVRKTDLDEWKITAAHVAGKAEGSVEFPIKNYEWPDGYDPLANPVVPGEDNLDEKRIPAAMREKLMKGYDEGGAAAPAPAPVEKKEEPKADAPKADAPAKADAPKADK